MSSPASRKRAAREGKRAAKPKPASRSTPRPAPGVLMWVPVRPTPLSRRITSQISSALFSGQIRPGDFLGTEASLAREFGVSRMVSRDALRGLEATGIVEIRQGARGGVRVAQGNADRFADALAIQLKLIGVTEVEAIDAQMALEATSAELAAGRATPADHGQLRRLLEESEQLVDQPEAFSRSAADFHKAIAAASRNRALVAQLSALHQVLRPANSRRTTRERAWRVVTAHRDLLARLESRDALGARQSMCCHLEGVRALAFANAVKSPSEPPERSFTARARARGIRKSQRR